MITIINWALFLFIGIPIFFLALSMFVARKAIEMNEELGSIGIIEIEPEEIERIPAKELRKLTNEIEKKGYRLVLGYTAGGMSATLAKSYSFVLYDKENKIYAEAFYIKPVLFIRALTFIFDRKNFHTHVLSYALYSSWKDGSRLVTTPERFVVSDILKRDKSQILPGLEIGALIQQHETALIELEASNGEALTFTSKEDYFQHFKHRRSLAYSLGPKTIEDCHTAQIND
jgi:hypothetical protein